MYVLHALNRNSWKDLFPNLQRYDKSKLEETVRRGILKAKNEGIHPAVVQLGIQYARGLITGGDGRCYALMQTFKRVIEDYQTPLEKILNRDLGHKINLMIAYLIECRPLSLSMGNAFKVCFRLLAGTDSNLRLKICDVMFRQCNQIS